MRHNVPEIEAGNLAGRVSMVTGATGGLGRVIAAGLARLGSTVVIVSRSAAVGDHLRRHIAAEVGADRAEVITGDLSSRAGLRHVAGEFAAHHDRLHLLVNNAGAHYRKRQVNADGIEMHVAVDYLAGFGLTTMSGYLLADQLHGTGVTVNAVHPGITATRIVDDIVHPLMKPFLGLIKRSLLTPAEGAAPILRLATAPELDGVTGRYFVRDAEQRSPAVSYDRDLQQRVRAASDAYIATARDLSS